MKAKIKKRRVHRKKNIDTSLQRLIYMNRRLFSSFDSKHEDEYL